MYELEIFMVLFAFEKMRKWFNDAFSLIEAKTQLFWKNEEISLAYCSIIVAELDLLISIFI